MKDDMVLDTFENMEKPIYPKAGEDFLYFLLKQKDASANVTISLSCSAVFDKNTAKAFEENKKAEVEEERQRVERERKEVKKKLAEKEVEVVRLRRDIVGKQIVVNIAKLRPSVVQPGISTKQKVKTVVVVDQKPEEVQMKTCVPPSNVINNKWIHNTRKAPGPYI